MCALGKLAFALPHPAWRAYARTENDWYDRDRGCGSSNTAAAEAMGNGQTPAKTASSTLPKEGSTRKSPKAVVVDPSVPPAPRRSRPSTPRNSGGRPNSRGRTSEMLQPELSLTSLLAATGAFDEDEQAILEEKDAGRCKAYGISMWALRAFMDANLSVIGRKTSAEVVEMLSEATSEWNCSFVDIMRANNVWSPDRGVAVSKARSLGPRSTYFFTACQRNSSAPAAQTGGPYASSAVLGAELALRRRSRRAGRCSYCWTSQAG